MFTRGVLNSDLMNVELQMITGHLGWPGLGLARESGDGAGDKEAARTLAH